MTANPRANTGVNNFISTNRMQFSESAAHNKPIINLRSSL